MFVSYLAFFILAAIVVFSGIGVVALSNPIHSALSLVVTLLGVASVFAMLEAHFLAAAQIIVYAGAIVVLILFVLMLLNEKHEPRTRGEIVTVGGAVLSGCAFLALLVPYLLSVFGEFRGGDFERIGADPEVLEGTVRAVGQVLFSDFAFPFEASSLLLMAAIVGAVALAKRSYR